MNPDTKTRAVALNALMHLPRVGRNAALKMASRTPHIDDVSAVFEIYLLWASAARQSPVEKQVISNAWKKASAQIEEGLDNGVVAIPFDDPEYPARLRMIPDPPAVLYVKGDRKAFEVGSSVAIIGTREPTDYGKEVAKRAGRTAAQNGLVVVSGLAHGCDTLAHEGCVEAEGRGIAVLAHGLDRVYPAANRQLADSLLERGGCLVSEYAFGVKPMRTFFAERDRLQSGLSDGIFVVETDEVGGTMHTVRFARTQKRKLACTAHPQRCLSEEKTRGNQKLIRERFAEGIPDGASLVKFFERLGTPHEVAPIAPPADQTSFAF